MGQGHHDECPHSDVGAREGTGCWFRCDGAEGADCEPGTGRAGYRWPTVDCGARIHDSGDRIIWQGSFRRDTTDHVPGRYRCSRRSYPRWSVDRRIFQTPLNKRRTRQNSIQVRTISTCKGGSIGKWDCWPGKSCRLEQLRHRRRKGRKSAQPWNHGGSDGGRKRRDGGCRACGRGIRGCVGKGSVVAGN